MGVDIITRPLYACLALLVLFIVIPVFAGIGTVGTSASAGLMSMQSTLADFTPEALKKIFGLGNLRDRSRHRHDYDVFSARHHSPDALIIGGR